ncbi:MAG: M24 family metallopeptidase [Christensenellales bacterium]
MYWLKQNVGKIPMTEISVSDKMLAFRQEQEHFISPSFNTICAYRANAAMMHYSATPETDAKSSSRATCCSSTPADSIWKARRISPAPLRSAP